MCKKSLIITILTDKTSWMNKYISYLSEQLQTEGHNVRIIYSQEELKTGDIAFFLSCFDIIKKEKLQFHKHNIVVHASPLPFGKGWSPMSWQILEGKNQIPIVLFEAVESVDAGVIYLQDSIYLEGTELIDEWHEILGNKTLEICTEFVHNYKSINGIKQFGTESFYRKRTAQDSKLDTKKNIEEQFNLLRIVDNEKYPAFFELYGQKYLIKIEKII